MGNNYIKINIPDGRGDITASLRTMSDALSDLERQLNFILGSLGSENFSDDDLEAMYKYVLDEGAKIFQSKIVTVSSTDFSAGNYSASEGDIVAVWS